MKFLRRWRLWMLMSLVLACALGLKAVLLVQTRRAAIERRARLLNPAAPPPQTPEEQAEAVVLLGDPDLAVRQIIVRKLAASNPTVPELIKLLGDRDPVVREMVAWELAQAGSTAPELVGPLIGMLEAFTLAHALKTRMSPGPNPIRALQRYRFPLPTIAPRLTPALANPDWHVRSAALAVLADAADRPGPGTAPEAAVAPLLAALGDADPRIRLKAAEILARLDPAARHRAGAVLLGQLCDPPDYWALLATVSLNRFDPEARAAAVILAGRLGAGDLRTRLDHLYLLGRLGPRARPVVPAIVRAMVAPEARDYALSGPGHFRFPVAPMAWTNIGVVETGFWSPYPEQIGTLGAAALGQIGPDADREAVALLVAMVRDGDEDRQRAAARALGDLGPRAAAAFPDLLALVERTTEAPPERRGDWLVAARLTRTLSQVVPGDDPRLVAALVRLLEVGTPMQRSDAALVLSYLEPPAPAAVPALIRMLQRGPQWDRCSAAHALGRYDGPEAEAAVPPLIKALADENTYVRILVAEALAHLHAGASQAVPVLVAILRGGASNYRTAAARGLGAFGPAAVLAAPALREARSDPVVLVRDEVEKALKLIEPPAPASDR